LNTQHERMLAALRAIPTLSKRLKEKHPDAMAEAGIVLKTLALTSIKNGQAVGTVSLKSFINAMAQKNITPDAQMQDILGELAVIECAKNFTSLSDLVDDAKVKTLQENL